MVANNDLGRLYENRVDMHQKCMHLIRESNCCRERAHSHVGPSAFFSKQSVFHRRTRPSLMAQPSQYQSRGDTTYLYRFYAILIYNA
jgi:hypothetical protein